MLLTPIRSLTVREKFRLSKIASIYGANASGKSNLVKAMKAMERFVLVSATQNEPRR